MAIATLALVVAIVIAARLYAAASGEAGWVVWRTSAAG